MQRYMNIYKKINSMANRFQYIRRLRKENISTIQKTNYLRTSIWNGE